MKFKIQRNKFRGKFSVHVRGQLFNHFDKLLHTQIENRTYWKIVLCTRGQLDNEISRQLNEI